MTNFILVKTKKILQREIIKSYNIFLFFSEDHVYFESVTLSQNKVIGNNEKVGVLPITQK